MSDRIGNVPMSIIAGTSSEERPGHDDEPHGDAQRVVLDPAGLDQAEAAAGLDRRRVPSEFTVPSTTSRSNHHMAYATLPPMTMNRKWLSSSNHHLLSDAR